jgi:Bacteriocin-protection, YdeI or OmpD-Associated/Domain of unknown function (DUF1905)
MLEESGNRLWGAHIRVPESAVKALTGVGSRRVLCTLNGSQERQCALVPYRDGSFVITVNKRLRDSLHFRIGQTIRVGLRRDESKYGLPVPEEFAELLRQDGEGDRLFHALNPGKRRTLLYIVGSPKKAETRLRRAVVVVQHLKANAGRVNYRQLYAALKRR